MLIDCHAHVMKRDIGIGHRLPLPEEQLRIMDDLGIDQSVILPTNHAESPFDSQSAVEVLEICEAHPGKFIPFCCPDPRSFGDASLAQPKKFRELLRQFASRGFRGIGEYTARLTWDTPCVQGLLEANREVRLPIIFHTTSASVTTSYGAIDSLVLPGLEWALRNHPEVPFIGHSAAFWSEISGGVKAYERDGYPKGPISPGGAIIRLLKTYPNLYCDLSGGSGLNALTRDPDFGKAFLVEFSGRLIFGLDICVPEARPGLPAFLRARLDDNTLTQAAFDSIASGNLLRLMENVAG